MVGWEFALLWLGWVLAGGSPGPATLGIAGTSMNAGRRLGLFFSLGILAGSAFWGLAAALGMSALMLANAWVFTVIKYIGAGYLLFLAFKSLKSAWSGSGLDAQAGKRGSARQVFTQGALIHITNPKAILSWGAVYAVALPPGASQGAVFALFALLYTGSILVFIGYAFLFSTPGIVRVYARAKRWFELAFGVLFGAAALRLLTARITP
ncbi:MAG: LysE family transporter [Pseudomonadota bacterium]